LKQLPSWIVSVALAWSGGLFSAHADTQLPQWTVTDALADRFLAAHGLRGFVGGYAGDGLEFWAYPLQLVSAYRLQLVDRAGHVHDALPLLERASVDPLGLSRFYAGSVAGVHVRLHERIVAYGNSAGQRVDYRLEGGEGLQLRASFHPALNLMWPAALGGQSFNWNDGRHGFVFVDGSGSFRAGVVSPQASAHTRPGNSRRDSRFEREVFLQMQPQACAADLCASLALAGQSGPQEALEATLDALLHAGAAQQADDRLRFDEALRLHITTPDAAANRALQWAQIALEQAWGCNPRLGCALLAGYGPSHGARRPQYAWYFAGDGLVATRALISQGRFARAAAELDFILHFQHPGNGMIWHEMSQSAPWLDWAGGYPYMYAHVDIAFDLLQVAAEYVRASGDRELLGRHWAALQRAYRYGLSTLDPTDGLPRIPADKMGRNEQDALSDELTLSSSWLQAARAMAELAAAKGDEGMRLQSQSAADRARLSLRARYRDEAGQRWVSGFSRAGKPMANSANADLAAIKAGAATAEETAAMLVRLAGPAYLTGWGLRGKPDTDPDYDPAAYAKGSVWALESAEVAEALWKIGHSTQAFALWSRLVPWSAVDAPGHMHEVMHGEIAQPQDESVPEQTWSSAQFLTAAVHGLLGLEVQAEGTRLNFVPQVPQDWLWLKIEQLPVGRSQVDLLWQRQADGRLVLEIRNRGPAFVLDWRQDGRQLQVVVASGDSRISLP